MEYLINLMIENPAAQIVGIFAYFLSAFSASQKDDYKLRLFMSISAIIWVAHHFLLHSYTAAILLFVIAIRCYMSSILLEKNFSYRLNIAAFFILLNAILTYFTWEGYISIFAFLAATVATVSVLLTKGFWTRFLLITVEIMWLFYNIKVGSLGGVFACLTDGLIMSYVLYKDFYLVNRKVKIQPINAI